MPTVVPESVWVHGQEGRSAALGEALEALLEFTGATAGWVGLIGIEGRLTFPATRGRFSPAWLALQQGPGVWGFEVREGPTLLNELPALPALGDPPLSNLLSCPITSGKAARGHVVLANKPNGFTSPDSSVLLGFAHWMSRWLLTRAGGGPPSAAELVPLLRRALDHLADGVLVVDAAGTLVFANARWSSWTGYPAEELVGRPAPFPFWVSHRELATLANRSTGPAHPAGVFPFRHRSDSVFWCQLETAVEELGGRLLTFAFLRRVPPTSPASAARRLLIHWSFLDVAEDLPFALALTDREGMVLWANDTFLDTVARTAEIQKLPLRTWFSGASAAALEHLFRTPAAQQGQVGRLALERPDETDAGGLMAYWLPARLPDGPGFLFAFSDDWEALCSPDDVTAAWQRSRPGLVRLALLLQPGAEVQFWDEHWQALTGLSAGDLAGVPSELVLDWLFPRQSDRERVADLLNLPLPRQPARLLLHVLDRTGSRSLSCTFLPVGGEGKERWLLLAGAPDRAPPDAGAPRTVGRVRADAPPTPLEPQGAPGVASVAEPSAGQEET